MRLFAGTEFDIPPTCDHCNRLLEQCQCVAAEAIAVERPPEKQPLRVSIEKRKKGKTVTVVRGLDAHAATLTRLTKQLKAHCGAGGSHRDSEIEIQGNHADRVTAWLTGLGYPTRQT